MHFERCREAIHTCREVEGVVLIDGCLQCGGVVGCSIALNAKGMHVDPGIHWRKDGDVGGNSWQ